MRLFCRVCFRITPGSERNNHIGAPVGHASDGQLEVVFILFHLYSSPPLASLVSLLAPLPPSRRARQLRKNHAPSRPHSLTPFLSLLSHNLSSSYFSQRRSTLSCSRVAPVRSQCNAQNFSFILLTFSSQFSCMSGTTMTRISSLPTPLFSYPWI